MIYVEDNIPLGGRSQYDVQPHGSAFYIKPDRTVGQTSGGKGWGIVDVPLFEISREEEPALKALLLKHGPFKGLTLCRAQQGTGLVGFKW
jgi:hypothetical protein